MKILSHWQKVLTLGIFVGSLFLNPNAQAATTRFTEEFTTRKNIDAKITTARVNTTSGEVSLQPITVNSASTKLNGSAINDVVYCGSKWLIAAGAGFFTYDGTNIEDLTDTLASVGEFGNYNIGCNGSTALMVTDRYEKGIVYPVVAKYDGTNLTSLDVTFPDDVSNDQVRIMDGIVDEKWVFYFYNNNDPIQTFDGSVFSPLKIVNSSTELGSGDFTLIVGAVGQLYKVSDGKALSLKAASMMFRPRAIWGNGTSWFVGGMGLGEDELRSHSLNSYDGSEFTDRTAEIKNAQVGDIAGKANKLLLTAQPGMLMYDGKQFSTYISGIPFVSVAWNGSYWLAGTFVGLNGGSGLYKIDDQYPTELQVIQSKRISTGRQNVTEATLRPIETSQQYSFSSAAAMGSSKGKIKYYLSNNGGKNWVKVVPGRKVKFTTTGKDLRWKAKLSTTNSRVSPVLKSLAITLRTK